MWAHTFNWWSCNKIRFHRLSRYMCVENFTRLSAAVHKLSCKQRKTDENNTVHRWRGPQQMSQLLSTVTTLCHQEIKLLLICHPAKGRRLSRECTYLRVHSQLEPTSLCLPVSTTHHRRSDMISSATMKKREPMKSELILMRRATASVQFHMRVVLVYLQ